MRFVRRNLALKLLALGLAIVTWWFVTGESKVLVSFNVPLEIRNLPAGMTLTNKVETHVEVRLQGPSSILAGFKASEISMALDLSAGKPGKQIVKFDPGAVRVPSGVTVQKIFPQAVEVVLARTERRRLPVSLKLRGGKSLRNRIASIEIDPKEVEVEALPEEFSRMPVAYTEEIVPDTGEDTFETEARVDLREPHAKITGDRYVRVKIRFRR
ncbi:MAG: CdaR family protein [Thermodesulfobacteriota bacterium]